MPFDDEYRLDGVTVNEDVDTGRQQYGAVVEEREPAYRESWEQFENALDGKTGFPTLIQPYDPEEDDGVHDPSRTQPPPAFTPGEQYGVDIHVPQTVDADQFGELVEGLWEYTDGLGARATAAALARGDTTAAILFGPKIVGSAAIHTAISRVGVPRYRCGYYVGDHEVYAHFYSGEEHNTINIQREPYNDHRRFVLKHLTLHSGDVADAAQELTGVLDDTGIVAPEGF